MSNLELHSIFSVLAAPCRRLVDVGAQSGVYTKLAADVMLDGHIIAFEPDPKYSDPLRAIKPLHGNRIDTICKALGDTPGTGTLYVQNTGTLLPIRKPNAPTAQVTISTLDHEVPDPVDLIKIDVEGYEHQVLLGATSHLARRTPLFLEVHHAFLQQANLDPADVYSLLDRYHYRTHLLWHDADNWADVHHYYCF